MSGHRALFAIVILALGVESASAACQRLPNGQLFCGRVERRETLGIPPPAPGPGPMYQGQGQPGPIYQGQGQPGPIYQGQGQSGPIYRGQGQPGPIYQGQGQPGPIYQDQGQPGPIYQPGQYPDQPQSASACFNPWGYCALTDIQSVGDRCWCIAPNGQSLRGVAR